MNGLILDHRRPDHPSTSRKPHKTTVGRSHHIRCLTAWNRCIAGKQEKYYHEKMPFALRKVMDDTTYMC
jgi:hypothetical protein